MDTTRYSTMSSDAHWPGGHAPRPCGSTGDTAKVSATSTNRDQDQDQELDQDSNNDAGDDDDPAFLPDLHGKSDILKPMHIRELSNYMPARAEGYAWTLAFSTTTMGFSLKSLYRSLSRYEGPVLLIIRDSEQRVFGAFSSCTLNPSDSFYGTGETYLFTFKQSAQSSQQVQSQSELQQQPQHQLQPQQSSQSASSIEAFATKFIRYPWTGDNLYFIKGNADSLAFGAGEGKYGLWLDEDLYHGSTHSCKTFSNEPLANSEDFVVCALECWCFL